MFDLESQYIVLPIVNYDCWKTGNGSGRGFCYGIKTINFIIGGDGTGDGDWLI
jgi:hypothetical protein